MSGTVVAVCTSEHKGERKKPVPSAVLREDHGIEGDAHAGEWHRQVSLLAAESIAKMKAAGLDVSAGDFAENLTTSGIDLPSLPLGTRLAVGKALLEVTQIGKECHTRCAIFHQAGDCVMPREGIFARVLEGGMVQPGDEVRIVAAPTAESRCARPQAVSFVAKSGTGKTTLLEKVIPELKLRGYRVGVIKHDAHRFDIDHPGKDSHRLTAAGADTMIISSAEKLAMVKKHGAPPSLEDMAQHYFGDVDIILTEGFRGGALPKIELHRRERSPSLLCRGEQHDPSLLAVASDEPLELDVPLLDLNDPAAVADFLETRILRPPPSE